MVNKSFALILFPFLTRALSVEDYGRLDIALYAAAFFGVVIIWVKIPQWLACFSRMGRVRTAANHIAGVASNVD